MIDLRSSGLWQSHFGQPIRACRLPIKLCIKSLIFRPLAATRFCNHMLMAGLRRFRLAGARILKKTKCVFEPRMLWELGRVVFSSQQPWVQRSKCCSFPEIGLTLNLFIYINLNPKGKMRLVSNDFSALQNVGPVST